MCNQKSLNAQNPNKVVLIILCLSETVKSDVSLSKRDLFLNKLIYLNTHAHIHIYI